MKKIVFVLMGVALLVSCKYHVSKTVTGSVEETRALTGFERIEMKGSMDVKYIQADSFSVKVSAPNDVIDKVETIVENNTLKVSMKHSGRIINFGGDSGDVTVYVTSPDFLGVSLMGSGDFLCEQPLDTDTLTIDLKGSGDIYFKDIICDHVSASVVGSGDVKVERVRTQQARLDVVGSGDIEMDFDRSGFVDAQVKGSGDIELKGTVKVLNQNVRGSGDIDTEELTIGK